MYLKSFDEQSNIKISMKVDELNTLCNALCEYCQLTDKLGNRLLDIRKTLYTIYETINTGANLDSYFYKIINSMGNERNEGNTF